MKMNISKKITLLVVVSIILVGLCTSIGGAILLGSKMMRTTKEYLRLSTYSIIKETAMMTAENTTMEFTNNMLVDFKAINNTDVTILIMTQEQFPQCRMQ